MKKTRKLLTTVTMLVIAAMMLSTVAFAATGEATVNSYMLNLREGAGTEYTIIDVAYQGNTVNVIEDDGSGWVKVEFDGMTGYMNSMYLTFTEDVSVGSYTAADNGDANGSIMGDGVHMRSGPSMSSSVLDVLSNGTPIQVNGACGEWYEVCYGGQTGYIYGSYVVLSGNSVVYTVTAATVEEDAPIYPEPATPEIDADPAQTEAVTDEPETTEPETTEPEATEPETTEPEVTEPETTEPEVTEPETTEPEVTEPEATEPEATEPEAGPVGSGGQGIVDTAMQYIGVPYVWGGTSPDGFDCSGLVYYVYGLHGVKLNRVAQSMLYNGYAVDTDDLQPGDILLFGSSEYNIWHAGIYTGNGNFIHAAGSGTTVRVQSLSSNYGMRLVAARRIF